jgi:hypothetical protein
MSTSTISWSHSCCSSQDLSSTLSNPEITAIEVDICWNSKLNQPTMKHQKESTDEQDFLTSTWMEVLFTHSNRSRIRIIKLDFKNVKAIRPTLVEFDRVKQQYSIWETSVGGIVEVWLNADILVGPGTTKDEAKPIQPELFFQACDEFHETFNNFVLSLGWTTNYSVTETYMYERKHIDEMIQILEKYRKNRRVTFPIRASLCRSSWSELRRLVEIGSFTLWTGVEGVPQDDLDWAQQTMKDSCYIDCDKGPRYGFYHPFRLFYYVKYLIKG